MGGYDVGEYVNMDFPLLMCIRYVPPDGLLANSCQMVTLLIGGSKGAESQPIKLHFGQWLITPLLIITG